MTCQPNEFMVNSLVSAESGRVFTTSLIVAEAFGKEHKNVLQSIDNLECSQKFKALNFQPSSYSVETGHGTMREYPAFQMTRDGFVFLVMGFTGKKAAAWKEKFLEAFNAMEAALRQRLVTDDIRPKSADSEMDELRDFVPASLTELQGLRGLIAFWSSIDGTPSAELEKKFLDAHDLPAFEYAQPWDMIELEWHLVKLLYRASSEITEEPASEEELRILNGLFDFACGLRGFSRSGLEGLMCKICNVPDLTRLTPLGIKKAELLLWTYINRYPTNRDCLSEAKYAVQEIGY